MRLHYPALLRVNIRRGRMCPSAVCTKTPNPSQINYVKEQLK